MALDYDKVKVHEYRTVTDNEIEESLDILQERMERELQQKGAQLYYGRELERQLMFGPGKGILEQVDKVDTCGTVYVDGVSAGTDNLKEQWMYKLWDGLDEVLDEYRGEFNKHFWDATINTSPYSNYYIIGCDPITKPKPKLVKYSVLGKEVTERYEKNVDTGETRLISIDWNK